MMDLRKLTALALSGVLSLSLLTACGPKENAPTGTPAPEVTDTVPPTTEPTVEPTTEPTAEPTDTPIDEPICVDPPAPTKEPATPAPTKAPATPKPTEKPAADLTAAGIYKAVSSSIGGNTLSDSSFILEEFYNLSASDLEDYRLYMPDMSTSLTEVFIAKVKDGKMDSVKAACQSRQKGLAEDAEFYPDTGAYVDSYQLVINGNWILFAVCDGAGAVASTFNSLTK